MNPIEQLNAAIEKEKGAAASIRTALAQFSAYVASHITDPVALQALVDALNTDADSTLAAIAANPVPGDVVTFGAKKK